MENMFTGLNQLPPGMSLPLFETRKALIIINLQNDSLYVKDDLYITKNPDFVPRLKEMIPYFRKHGDIVWVFTHMGVLPFAPSPDAAKVEEEAAKVAEKNRQEQERKEKQMKEDQRTEQAREEAEKKAKLDPIDPNAGPGKDYPMFYPSSRTKDMMTRASAETRAEKRTADLQVFDDKNNTLEKHLSKPRKGQQARFYIAGTKGAEICDELVDVVDESLDLVVTKHHYSAFDQTSLLTALRARLVTEVYLCGCLTNVGVYSTAADAVQHGLQVTVVEDCLGYRSEDKHEEAMRQMADIMGVHGIDSEEIIEESGGRPVPDAKTPGITLEELTLHSPEVVARGSSVAVDADTTQHAQRAEPYHSSMVGIEANGRSAQSPIHLPHPVNHAAPVPEEMSTRDDLAQNPSPGLPAPRNRGSWNISRSQTLGPNDSIGSGDSRIVYNVIRPPTIDLAFDRVKEEVSWQTMFHRSGQVPRLVAVQGEVGKGGEMPIYRHPADESPPLLPFTPIVQQIRQQIESFLSQSFNHALIQLYRDGVDNISEHSDKTLDIVRGSVIANVSIGAQRMMTLRTKRSKNTHGTDSPNIRQSQRIIMPHNSVFVLGSQTNREWLHGVRADKRPGHEKTEAEKAFSGERISITFRKIGTFMSKKGKTIWGAGAKKKTKAGASRISTKDDAQMEAMINAFGEENHNNNFDWEAEYGSGFDVVNLVNEQAKLTLCSDAIANTRVQLALCEKSISFTANEREMAEQPEPEELKTRFHTWMHGLSNSENPVFHDVNENGSESEGDLAIMFYLEKNYPFPKSEDSSTVPGQTSGNMYSQIAKSNELLFLWRELRDSQHGGRDSPPTHRFNLERPITPNPSLHEEFHSGLKQWEALAENAEYIAGDSWTIIDCAFWPVLNHLVAAIDELNDQRYPHLLAYHKRVLDRECVTAILGGGI